MLASEGGPGELRQPITVLVADDDELVREALMEVLGAEPDLDLVAVAVDAKEAVRLATEHQPVVALLDVRMPGGGGALAAAEIRRLSPETRLIALSALEDRAVVAEMLRNGVHAYLLKGVPNEEIVDAIRRAARGQFSMSADLAEAMMVTLREDAAGRREREHARQRAEERASAMLEASLAGVALVDAQGTVLLANRRLLDMFRTDAEAILGRPVDQLLSARSRRAHGRKLRPSAQGSAQLSGLSCLRADGSEFPAEVQIGTLPGRTEPEAVLGFVDLGAERELPVPLPGVELSRRMLEAAPDAMVMVDPEGRIEIVNEQTERLFGYTRAELLGSKIELLLPKRLSKTHVAHRSKFFADPQTRPMGFGLSLFGRRKDGVEFPVDISLSPVETAKGSYAVAAIRDITERRRSEDTLRKVDERFRDLVESSPDGMVIINAAGVIQQVNGQAEMLFGYGRGELLGKAIEMLLPERFRAVHVGHRSRYLARPQPRPMGAGLELFGRRKDGSEFPVDISLTPLQSPEGGLGVAHVRDVTARKRSERELLLAHLVRAQEEERLRIASDIHDDTIQAITAAGLRLQLLRRQLTDEKQLETLKKLEDTVQLAIQRLRNLMFDLRPPALERDGLAAAVRTYLDQLQVDSGIVGKLESKLSEEPPLETRAILFRIIQESLTNVRKHSKANTVKVRLETAEGGYGGSVEDDGVGFEVDQVQPRAGHLGLAAMRERAEMARGRLELTSIVGSGTKLRFWVPRDAGLMPEAALTR